MIRFIANYLQSIPSVFIDGSIYCWIAIVGFLLSVFGGDEAAKYVSPLALFWTKTVLGSLSAGLLAIKMYRSTAFADHIAKKDSDTKFYVKNQNVNTGP